jgi:hypothetical protein
MRPIAGAVSLLPTQNNAPAARRRGGKCPLRTSQRYRSGGGGSMAPLGDLRTSETSALMKEPAKFALPNSVSPTASTRQTTQLIISRLDNLPNMRHNGIGTGRPTLTLSLAAQKGSWAFTLGVYR